MGCRVSDSRALDNGLGHSPREITTNSPSEPVGSNSSVDKPGSPIVSRNSIMSKGGFVAFAGALETCDLGLALMSVMQCKGRWM